MHVGDVTRGVVPKRIVRASSARCHRHPFLVANRHPSLPPVPMNSSFVVALPSCVLQFPVGWHPYGSFAQLFIRILVQLARRFHQLNDVSMGLTIEHCSVAAHASTDCMQHLYVKGMCWPSSTPQAWPIGQVRPSVNQDPATAHQ